MALTYLDPQSWTPGSGYTDPTSWGDASTPKSASDALTLSLVEARGIASILATTDALTATLTDVSQAPVITGTTPKSASDPLLLKIVETAPGVILPLTLKTASDSLLFTFAESYVLLNGFTPVATSDSLLVTLTEAPTGSYLVSTDDALVPIATETSISPAPTAKVASDILTLVCTDAFNNIAVGGFAAVTASDALLLTLTDLAAERAVLLMVSASDSLTLIAADAAQNYFRSGSDLTIITCTETSLVTVAADAKSASDALTLACVDTSAGIVSIATVPKTASDTLTLVLADRGSRTTTEAPVVGALPPGWTEAHLTELTGIERPRRYEPGNVQPIQGWFKRDFWAVYDERGNIRATDRWQGAARAQAWTQYQSGRLAA